MARESLWLQPNDALLEMWRAGGLDEELADGRGLRFDSRPGVRRETAGAAQDRARRLAPRTATTGRRRVDQ
jgi:hypothetical protein